MQIIVNNYEEWQRALNSLCVCGHSLWRHANTRLPMGSYPAYILPSQCVMCGIVENKFVCERFRPVGENKEE